MAQATHDAKGCPSPDGLGHLGLWESGRAVLCFQEACPIRVWILR